jgi:hypothetical protein
MKEQERLRDIQLQKEAIARVEKGERDRKQEFEARETKIATFMKATEQGAIADDNKKFVFLQQMFD